MVSLSSSLTRPTSEQVWSLYKDIEKVAIARREQLKKKETWPGNIDRAIQRLWQAISIKYNLNKTDHPEIYYYNGPFDSNHIKRMDLSTTEAMVNAKIPEWEDAIQGDVSYNSALDDYTGSEGQRAGYYFQPSLQQKLGRDYFELRAIFNIKPAEALENYYRIERVVHVELGRLSSEATSTYKNKAIEVQNALTRLFQATLHKYGLETPENIEFNTKIQASRIEETDLYTVDKMLDARFYEWEPSIAPFTEPSLLFFPREAGFQIKLSLREALNIAVNNWFNVFSGTQGPLWGTSTALETVEYRLGESPKKDS